MDPSQEKSPLVPHEPLVPNGMLYCSETAQQSLATSLEIGEVPEAIQQAASLFSTRQRFELMQTCLVSLDRRARESAVHIFSEYPDMFPALIESLTDKAWGVRAMAAEGLAHHKKPEAVDRLIPLLQDDIETVRIMAAHALGELGAIADKALPALQEAAFGPPLDFKDPEEQFYLLPLCNAEIQRLNFKDAGKDRTQDHWGAGTYQLYAAEAFDKIRASIERGETTAETNLATETIAREYPPATSRFLDVLHSSSNDDQLSHLSDEQLIDVVREDIPSACGIASSMLGTRGCAEAIPVLSEALVNGSHGTSHHVRALRDILNKNPSVGVGADTLAGIEKVLFGDKATTGTMEAAHLLREYPTEGARNLLIKALVLGNDTAQYFAEANLYKMTFSSKEAAQALAKIEEYAADNSEPVSNDKVQHITAFLKRNL